MANHRSVSQVTTWLQCGERYRLERVCKAPSYPGAWLASGRAFHNATERYEKSDRKLTVPEVQAIYVAEYLHEIDELMEEFPDLKDWGKAGKYGPQEYIDSLIDKGQVWVADYITYVLTKAAYRIARLPDGSPAIEVPFFLDLEVVQIRGYIDQVIYYPGDRLYGVVDLKTGTKKPKDTLQLGTYATAYEDMFDIRPTYGSFYMAKEGKHTYSETLELYTKDYLRQIYGDLDRAVDNEIFIPNPSSDNCRPCGVQRFCPSGGGTDTTYLR